MDSRRFSIAISCCHVADVGQSVAKSSIWNYCYPILDGLLVKLKAGRDFTAIPEPVI